MAKQGMTAKELATHRRSEGRAMVSALKRAPAEREAERAAKQLHKLEERLRKDPVAAGRAFRRMERAAAKAGKSVVGDITHDIKTGKPIKTPRRFIEATGKFETPAAAARRMAKSVEKSQTLTQREAAAIGPEALSKLRGRIGGVIGKVGRVAGKVGRVAGKLGGAAGLVPDLPRETFEKAEREVRRIMVSKSKVPARERKRPIT